MGHRGRHRKARVRDFDRRTEFTPSAVLRHPRGWAYIPIRFFADDRLVDAWWRGPRDVVLLAVEPAAGAPATAEVRGRPRDGWRVRCTVDAPVVTRAVFEDTMARLVDRGMLLRRGSPGRYRL